EEAKQIWKKVAGDITIIPIATSDNFWSMGDTGPCGPCSEIFYDHGDSVPGGMPGTPEEDGDRFMEIWNVVFMQFEQLQNGERIPLKKKSIDTGMGLERIAGVMQGVLDNYQTDTFKSIISEIKSVSKTNHEDIFPSYKVIADHIRSVSFLIAEGILPSNEGRGYVLRRIMRRAMRHGNLLGIKEPFLYKLSDTLVDVMKGAYPELEKRKSLIASTIHTEEEKFLDTLDRGLKILQNDVKDIPSHGVLSGDKAFKLYDTYGFPLDLTQDILKADNITVDTEGFEKALQEQKNRAKWAGSGEKKESVIWHQLKEKLKQSEFVGYDQDQSTGKILAIIQNDAEVNSLSSGKAYIVTDTTPFYAECGGQCGDTGTISTEHGVFKVTDTQKFCDTIIAHEGELISGHFNLNDNVNLQINSENRKKIRANHTATHLLQAALRQVLGEHVAQRGSSLDENRLRFDFANNSALSEEDLLKVEHIVNTWITDDLLVNCIPMTKSDAIAAGATALFGEKYGDVVRTVCVGNEKVSFELCGGTHVRSTGQIGAFKILSEVSIGAGIRRIEAITGLKVLEKLGELEHAINSLADKLKCAPTDISQKISDLLTELKRKNQEIATQKISTAVSQLQISQKNGVNVYLSEICDYSVDEMRSLNDAIRKQYTSGINVILNKDNKKVSIIVSVSKDLQVKYNAGQLLKKAVAVLNGNGGGNASFAQGGGSLSASTKDAVQQIVDAL
nr:alanine--tRNA ligase [Alphaproteobacteria bacterium]